MSRQSMFPGAFPGSEDDLERIAARLRNIEEPVNTVRTLAAAVVAQEVTRIAVTKSRMDVGVRSDVDKSQLVACWRVLGNHYEGSRAGEALVCGVEHLERLPSKEASDVVYEIRCMVKPVLDKEMEEEELELKFDIPLLGKIGLGKFRWAARGPRVAIRKLRVRLLRYLIEGVLWTSVLLGAVHWFAWMIFDQPYLSQQFDGIAKAVQFILLALTTLNVLVFGIAISRRGPRVAIRWGGSAIIVTGWGYWLMWVLLDQSIDGVVVEGLAQIGVLVFVLSGGIACWIVRLMLRPATVDQDT